MDATFHEFQPDPAKNAQENAVAFMEWLIQSQTVLHQHQMNQARLLVEIRDMISGAIKGPPAVGPQAGTAMVHEPRRAQAVAKVIRDNAPWIRELLGVMAAHRRHPDDA